jgi:acetyl-CoA carboxylase biotin carboxylase subunit
MKIKKILIANRGEIAVRIIRCCQELGIKTVSVYSEADKNSLHVKLSDESICIGSNNPYDSYLRSDRIISAANITSSDAIHPGYGFLSENSNFANECESSNIKFIGPTYDVIDKMGNKSSARIIAKQEGIPIIPGTNKSINSLQKAIEISDSIGYPIIIKSTFGGGGKGMRLIKNKNHLKKEYNIARLESQKNFGREEIYIEKYIQNPIHVEFQIVADEYQNIIHLGERDCSIQRRYQKVIEESPSPFFLNCSNLREEIGNAAVKLAKSINYKNVGTIEFLIDKSTNEFYFSEMNTRIQVEHGVTELLTGIDILRLQILISMGSKLLIRQEDVEFKNHVLECRINAEDPKNDFSPFPGKINFYHEPGGNGIRIDTHCFNSYFIPPYYDSLISKIITYDESRNGVIRKMLRALNEYKIKGIKTNLSFLKLIMNEKIFKDGKKITTNYIKNFLSKYKNNL